MRTTEELAMMGFAPGKAHAMRLHRPADDPLGILSLIDLMKPGTARIIRLATLGGGNDGNALTVDVQITTMTAVQCDGGEFPIDGIYKVLEPQWLETVGARFGGQIISARHGVSRRVMLLEAPRDVTGYFELVAVTPEPWVYAVLFQFVTFRPSAKGEITMTSLSAEFE